MPWNRKGNLFTNVAGRRRSRAKNAMVQGSTNALDWRKFVHQERWQRQSDVS